MLLDGNYLNPNLPVMPLFQQRIRWVCLVVISLSVLFWYGRVIRSDRSFPIHNGLRGYIRITPGRMNQVRCSHVPINFTDLGFTYRHIIACIRCLAA